MPDLSVSDEIAALVAERDWLQFHTPETLAKSISIEADPKQIIRDKLAVSRTKYPADKARGSSTKYDAP